MILQMELDERNYAIRVERGCLQKAGQLLNLKRKVCIVTDSGVPRQYVEGIARRCKDPMIVTVEAGEGSKTLDKVAEICRAMMQDGFSRRDCVVAVGGGMVGDLAGFAAASFMRGVDFYNIPTTLLSQVDSSIGGKTGVNLDGVKNMVGAFHQPRGVLIDPDTLGTLPPRLRAEGMAEYVKMALCFDAELFEELEREDPWQDTEKAIHNALSLKKMVVEADVREAGLRKLLNFGHTIGHGVERAAGGSLYHGECVAIGMMPMCSDAIRARLQPLLKKLGLPESVVVTAANCDGHDCGPAVNVTQPGQMMLVIGTSTGLHVLGDGDMLDIPGICGRYMFQQGCFGILNGKFRRGSGEAHNVCRRSPRCVRRCFRPESGRPYRHPWSKRR